MGKISLTEDLWSDHNLAPFMAVTSHWIQTTTIQTADGPQHILKLRCDLIAFIHVPGRHNGEHLAEAFLGVLDRIGITSKVCSPSYIYFSRGFLHELLRLGG